MRKVYHKVIANKSLWVIKDMQFDTQNIKFHSAYPFFNNILIFQCSYKFNMKDWRDLLILCHFLYALQCISLLHFGFLILAIMLLLYFLIIYFTYNVFLAVSICTIVLHDHRNYILCKCCGCNITMNPIKKTIHKYGNLIFAILSFTAGILRFKFNPIYNH